MREKTMGAEMRYVVLDRKTKSQVGVSLSTRRRAKNKADKLDLVYGAYRYHVVVEKKETDD